MNWSAQISLSFQLLNNAALLAVGTVGYCELRHRIRDRLPSGLQAMLYGVLFGVLGILVSLAPGITAIGYPITLRIVVIVFATLYCGVAAGAMATLLQVAHIAFLQLSEPALGLPLIAALSFALSAAYRTLFPPRDGSTRLGELSVLAVVIMVTDLGVVAWLRGPATFAAGFAVAGPAWAIMSVLSTISLGAVIRHIDRSHTLAVALNESERRFRAFYNETPVMSTAIDQNDRFVAVSDRWLQFMGYAREEVIGKSRYDFLAPPSATQIQEDVLPVLKGGNPIPEIELQLTRKDGTLVDVSVTFALSKDPVTGAEQVLSFTIDQTARKRAERALEQRESDLRAIADHAPFTIFLKDRDGRYRLVNRHFEQATGLNAEDIIGRTDSEVVRPDFAEQIRASDLPVLERGQTHQFERQPTRKRVPDEYILVTKFPIRDGAGQISGIAGFAVDITERKRAEMALRDRERDLRAIMDHAPFAIFLKDRDRRYRLVNRRYTEWFGHRTEDICGHVSGEIFPESVSEASARADAEVLQEGRIAVRERAPLSEKTTIEYLQITQFPIRDEHGEISGIAGFCADISERRRNELALAQSRELLLESQRVGRLGYLVSDLANDRVHWSESLFELRQVPPREFFTFGEALAFVHPEDQAEYLKVRNAAIAERQTFRFDARIVRGDGSMGWEHAIGRPRYDHTGKCTGVLIVVQDITDRKRAEQVISESRELLIQSQRLGKIGHLVSDRKSNRVYWSDTLFELRGVPKREFFTYEETETTPFIHPADRAPFQAARDAGIAERRDFEIDIRVQRPSGVFAWESVMGRPRYGADGTLESVLYVLQDITERKEAEEVLKRREAVFRALTENAPFAIFLKDNEGRYRFINSTYTDWFGDRPEDLIGRTAAEVYPAEQVQEWEVVDREILRTGRVVQDERRVLRAKPGIEHTLSTKFPIRDDDGVTIGFAGIVADITARKCMELALRETQGRLQAILDNAPYAIFLKDRDMRYQLINRTFTDWFGERPEDLIGRRAAEVYPVELVEQWEAIDEELMRTGHVAQEERPVLRARPGIEHVLTTKFPVHDQDGTVIGFAGIIADITARRRAEQALRHSEARFRALIEHSNDMVDVVDRDGCVTYRSSANAEVLGYADEEVVGHSIGERVHPDDAPEIINALKSLANGSRARAMGRSRLRHKNGSWRTVAWSARDARDVPGIDGIIVNSRDITEAQLLEQQLQESQKMDAVGQLAGGVAHDFNNILGAILGFGGFLLHDLSPDIAEHGFAERIVKAAERGKELVQQILAFARRSTVERKPFDLNGLVCEARELMRASVPSSTRLEVQVCKAPLVAEVNAGQVTQILVNLCLNANDALEAEPGNIMVNLSRVEPRDIRGASLELRREGLDVGRVIVGTLKPGTAYARIAVADSGIGMNAEVLTHIFDPFFTTKRRGRGTGLGLSVVHGIVMAYEGALVVTSKPANGSVFEVYLPLCDARPETSSPAVPVPAQRGCERVLVVDDEPMMTDVMTTGLDRLGYESVGVHDALVVTQLFAEDPTSWDVVISDQVMPKMKGLALCRALKRIRPSLCFILCTGFSEGLTEEEALSAGADAFFLKPVRPEEVATAIRKVLARDANAAE